MDAIATIEDVWDRIHVWMTKHAPRMLRTLNKGATDYQMRTMLEKLDLNDLPEDFKASYGIHNGSLLSEFFGFPEVYSFHPIENIVVDWTEKKDVPYAGCMNYDDMVDDGFGIRKVFWSFRWIPFGGDKHGNLLCLDLDPTDDGCYGQVFQWYEDETFPELIAGSFTEFLTEFTLDLENAQYTLTDDCQKFVYKYIDRDR